MVEVGIVEQAVVVGIGWASVVREGNNNPGNYAAGNSDVGLGSNGPAPTQTVGNGGFVEAWVESSEECDPCYTHTGNC